MTHVSPLRCSFLASLLAASVAAQAVDFPDSSHAHPPAFSFPFYTTGSGSTGDAVRLQLRVPAAFLQQQNVAAGLVTRVGFSLGGVAPYDTFVLRAGVTAVPSLGPDWAVNLPDQRVQNDLSGTTIAGGGTAGNPLNRWVEFELDHPFFYTPGESVVVDVTSRLELPGVLLGTTVGGVERAYNFVYTPGQPATSFNSGGVSVRLVFGPHELVTYGAGCAGTAGRTPVHTGLGAPAVGNAQYLLLATDALPGAFGGFALGFSRNDWAGAPLPIAFGGGCELRVASDAFAGVTVDNVGSAAVGLAIPGSSAVRGLCVYSQFAVLDPQAASSVQAAFSNAGITAIW